MFTNIDNDVLKIKEKNHNGFLIFKNDIFINIKIMEKTNIIKISSIKDIKVYKNLDTIYLNIDDMYYKGEYYIDIRNLIALHEFDR